MRRMMTLIVLGLLAGCVQTNAVILDPTAPPHEPVHPDEVRIFTDDSELESLNYVRVALIEATGSGEYTDQSGMIRAMREKAGKLGANGILLPQINEPGAGAKVAAALFGVGTQRKGSVVAIRVLDRAPAEGTISAEDSVPQLLDGPHLLKDVMLCPNPDIFEEASGKTHSQQLHLGCIFTTDLIAVEPLEIAGEYTQIRLATGWNWWVRSRDLQNG